MNTNKMTRVKSLMKLDFYRLFHTPAFYIMLVIAAIIPAMLATMTDVDATGTAAPSIEITNAWQLVESTGGSAAAASPLDFGGYANINMVFIFAGLLMAIFVAHDYSSGFMKNIFTVHAKKMDYVVSKSAAGIFGGACMILTYVIGTVIAGLIAGASFEASVGGLIACLLSKVLLMGIFCSLFLAISVLFKSRLWLTIVFTFLFGMMLYPAASVVTLDSNVLTILMALVAGAAGVVAIGAVSTLFLKKRDLA